MSQFLYNPVLNRWLNSYKEEYYYDENNHSAGQKSVTFKADYDDPTYMTFKIEFGDWGASILDRRTLQMGTTSFVASKFDYDALPIGLLNCPFEGALDSEKYWQTKANDDSSVFNNNNMYSAFAYLRSRNEDTRAKYLYYFVNGLMEIQKDTPYLFKKITGLESLEAFDPKSGQRLKDAKITVECFEGLSLKIRTLMEFYRKAAWDDVYQRWILPENMREFKMIIYVFERRTFLDVITWDVNANGKLSVQTEMVYDSINADIPIKAYECCPCEFDIAGSQSWRSDYAADLSNPEESSKLVIRVKNVKTFYKNGLLNDVLSKQYNELGESAYNIHNKIEALMIYDLVESIERRADTNDYEDEEDTLRSNITNSTVNTVRSLFLNKNVLLENEDAIATLRSYVWGHSMAGPMVSSEYIRPYTITEYEYKKLSLEEQKEYKKDKNSNRYTKLKTNSIDDTIADMLTKSTFTAPIDAAYIQDSDRRAGWITTLVQGLSYDKGKSFWSNLGDNILNILTGARRLILVSGNSNLLTQDTFSNILSYLFPETSDNINYFSKATEGPVPYLYTLLPSKYNAKPIEKIKFSERQIDNMQFALMEDARLIDPQQFSQMEDPRLIDNMQFALMEPERDIPNQQFDKMLDPRQIDDMQFSEMEPERLIPAQQFDKMLPERNIPDQDFSEMEPERNIPDLKFSEMQPERNIPEQDFSEMLPEREIPDMKYDPMLPEREVPDMKYDPMLPEREVPVMAYDPMEPERKVPGPAFDNMEPEREVPAMTYDPMEPERNVPKLAFDEMLPEREVPENIDKLLMVVRTLPAFQNITMEDIRQIPEQELTSLADNVSRTIPEYQINRMELLDTISKATETPVDKEFVRLDKQLKDIEQKAIDMLSKNKTLVNLKNRPTNNHDALKQLSIIDFAKLFSENSKDIKDAFINNITNKKALLKSLSEAVVRELPEAKMIAIKNGNYKDEKIKDTLVSLTDLKEIDKNMKLISMQDATIREMSFQSLISLNKEFEERIISTQNLIGLSQITEVSKATSEENKKSKKLVNTKKEKKSKRKKLGKSELVRMDKVKDRHTHNDNIVY